MPDTQPEAELGLTEGVRGMRGAMGHLPSGLDSGKAMAIAMETAAGKRLLSTGSQGSIQTCDKAVLVSKAEEYLKTPRSSVGIQVYTHTHMHTGVIYAGDVSPPPFVITSFEPDTFDNWKTHCSE